MSPLTPTQRLFAQMTTILVAMTITISLPLTVTSFAVLSPLRQHHSSCSSVRMKMTGKGLEELPVCTHKEGNAKISIASPLDQEQPFSRRKMFKDVFRLAAASAVGLASGAHDYVMPNPAYALAKISEPLPEAVATYDVARDKFKDFQFANGMASGMERYERDASTKKRELFQKLFSSLSNELSEPVVVEVGIGSFPNAPYYKGATGLDIIGVDPNDSMGLYAKDNAAKTGVLFRNSLRIVHGVGEALPLADNSCDAIVSTLTLCSVIDPAKCVAEAKRVLKPGGKFLFWEHVLSETDPDFARRQIERTPAQVKRADGCHLNRKTGDIIQNAGFKMVDMEYFELKKYAYIGPTVCGIATA